MFSAAALRLYSLGTVTTVAISYFQKPWGDSISLRPSFLRKWTPSPWSATLRRWERNLAQMTIISRCLCLLIWKVGLPLVLGPGHYNLPHPHRCLHPASGTSFSPGHKPDNHTLSASSLQKSTDSPALPVNPQRTAVNIERAGQRALSDNIFSCRLRDFNLILSSALHYDTAMSWSLHSHRRNYFHWHLSFLILSSSCVCLLTNQSCQSHLSLWGEKYLFDNCIFL